MIGTWMRMAMMGGLGAASASAVAAGVAAPVALQAAADAPVDAPDAPAEDAPEDEPSCGKKPKKEKDNLGAKVRVWHDEGLRGRDLAAEIHAHHGEKGRGRHGR